jgi:hypothetical protein
MNPPASGTRHGLVGLTIHPDWQQANLAPVGRFVGTGRGTGPLFKTMTPSQNARIDSINQAGARYATGSGGNSEGFCVRIPFIELRVGVGRKGDHRRKAGVEFTLCVVGSVAYWSGGEYREAAGAANKLTGRIIKLATSEGLAPWCVKQSTRR